MRKLQEKILLEEPEDIEKVEMNVDELPPVELDKPIELEAPEVSDEEKANGLINIISNEISDTYNNISILKSIVTTLNLDFNDRDDLKDILNNIIDERTMHVGMLQKAIDLLNNEHKDLLTAGEEKAETIVGETINDTQE